MRCNISKNITKKELTEMLENELHSVFLKIVSLRILGNKMIYDERLNDLLLDREKAVHHKNIIKILYENINDIDNYYLIKFDENSPFLDLVIEINDELTSLILLELI